MDTNRLIGVWSLVSFVKQNSNGQKFYPWGEDTVGQLIYTSMGYMSVTYMKCGRKRFKSQDKAGGTGEEIKEAFMNFDAYAGTYEIDTKAGTVTHNVRVSREPNLEGTNLLRRFRFTNDTLELITPPILAHGQENIYTLSWKRIG